jgi:rfaE bifunctional protein nucleotidyltransferase chain/domain
MSLLTSTTEARAWREAGGDVGVVAGTFDILHPGNLAALRCARAATERVIVLVEPDALALRRGRDGTPRNPETVRAELAAQLRGVAAVAVAGPDARAWAEALQPFAWVTRGGLPAEHPMAAALADMASALIEASGEEMATTASVNAAIAASRTPVNVSAALYPARASDDLGRVTARDERPLVTVNGCFDVLHIGHIRFLNDARTQGCRLVVLVNDDHSVSRYKGPTRPVFPVGFRIAALEALRCVDGVVPFSGDNPLDLIRRLKPDVHVKGGSFEPDRVRAERELVEQWGGRLVCLDLVAGFSTTGYIRSVGSGATAHKGQA